MAGGTLDLQAQAFFFSGSKFTLWRSQFLTSTTRYSRVIRIIAGGIPVREGWASAEIIGSKMTNFTPIIRPAR